MRKLYVASLFFCLLLPALDGEIQKNILDVTKRGSVREVQKLLDAGVSADTRGRGGRTALHVASMLGFKKIAELLIAHGANVNMTDSDNATPLHMAVLWFGKEPILELLLAAGADPNIRDKQGTTPLFYAAVGRCEKSVDLLTAYGAKGLDEVLRFAIRNERQHVIKICLTYGDADVLCPDRWSPLHESVKTGNADIVSLLLLAGASVERCDEQQATPLRYAVHKGMADIVALLIDHGADTGEKSESGNALLHDAVWYGATRETMTLLLLHGGYVNVRDAHERTPLHIAAICGMPEIIKMLRAHGADIDAKDRHGKTPLEYAKLYRETGVYGDAARYDKAIAELTASGR